MYNYKAAAEGHVEGNKSFELPALLRLDGFPKEFDFHPIGADAVPAVDSANEETRKPARLFVINHSGKWSAIEVFDLYPALKASEWSASYIRTIDHPLAALQPNALTALSHNDILVTQDHLFALRARPFSQLRQIYSFLYGEPMGSALTCFASLPILRGYLTKIETILGLRTGFVTRVQIEEDHDRVSVSLFDRGIAFANGIARSPNGEIVAVASTMMPGVLLYERQHTSKGFEWTITDYIFTPNMADNIAFSRNLVASEQGERSYFGNGSQLLVTGAISGPMMVRFAKDPKNMSRASPSWVVAITPKAKDVERTEDNAPLPVQERLLGLHDRYEIKTLYQGHKPTPLSAPHYGFGLVGITAAAGASMDVTVGGGTLLVAGILSDPGVMICYGVGQ